MLGALDLLVARGRDDLPNRIVSPRSMTMNQINKDFHKGTQLTQFDTTTLRTCLVSCYIALMPAASISAARSMSLPLCAVQIKQVS